MGNAMTESKGIKRRHEEIEDESKIEAKRRKLKATIEYMHNDLFQKGEGSDVTLMAFGKLWNLHKICLSRVDYFKHMFGGTWSEADKKLISLQFSDDLINEEAFSKTMETLYCDEIEITTDIAPHLLATSSWFGMVELINLTTAFLSENLTLNSSVHNYNLADKYNCQSLKESCVEFLAYNVMVNPSVQVLKEMSAELMRDVLSCPSLCVLNMEQDVYRLLSKWLYLKLYPDWEGAFSDLAEDLVLPCFLGESSKSFLETDVGEIFSPAFESLRLDHAICSRRFCNSMKKDNLIPKSRKVLAYEEQWSNLLRIKECSPGISRRVSDENFERSCMRYGRVLMKSEKYCWKWVGFNFGCDMIFFWNCGTLKVKRNLICSSSLFDSCSSHILMYRIELFSLNTVGRKTFEYHTGIKQAELDLYTDVLLLKVDEGRLKFPLYLSCKLFHPMVQVRPCSSSRSTKSLESLNQRSHDFDTRSLTISYEEDGSRTNDTEQTPPQPDRSSTSFE